MAQKSEIEWTDATWNPVTGCTKVGPGCDNCYAERFAERWRGVAGHPYEQGFDLKIWPSRLEQPLQWKKPRMIFVNSMSDLFHKDIDRRFIDSVFDTMERADWHVYQVLTKRSSLLRNYVGARYAGGPVPRHIWLGVSVEDAAHASRIRHLKEVNSEARFISFEPLLGPIDEVDLRGIAWAIVGGESGPGARPMQPDWARRLRDISERDGVAFFFKQWGGARPKSGGRLLDGEEWNGSAHALQPAPTAGAGADAAHRPHVRRRRSGRAQWRTSRAEYQRGIMEAISDAATETVVIMSSAQVGKTEVLNNACGYHIDQDPAPIMVVMPTERDAETWSKDRFSPMARDTPCLQGKIADPRSRDGNNKILHKRFPGGHLTIVGANAPSGLASRPIRLLLCDEVDRYPFSAGAAAR